MDHALVPTSRFWERRTDGLQNRGAFQRPCSRVLLVLLVCSLGNVGLVLGVPRIRQVAYINHGTYWTFGLPVVYAGQPRHPLMIFTGGIPGAHDGLYFYRYSPVNSYALVRVDTGSFDPGCVPGDMTPWTASDVDGDSRPELLAYNCEQTQGGGWYTLAALYRPSPGGICPDSLVWSARYDSNPHGYACQPFYVTDLDRDGRKEVLFWNPGFAQILAYEHVTDNFFRRTILMPANGYAYAIGDFDGDSLTEFASAGSSWDNWVWVYKCVGDDQYAPWDSVPISLPNGHDAFAGQNLDGTHRAMCFVSFFSVSGWAWLYQFEPTQGTRGYRSHLVDSVDANSGEIDARSTCGDIDGDGIEEILWSIGTGIRVYKCTGPHSFECVWTWFQGLNASCNLNLYDVNGNGYNEILESGSGVTHIFEIEAIKVLYPNGNEQFRPGDTCRIRWETYNPPRCDSISLFLRSDTAWSLDTIVHGLPPSDTSYRWIVPDVPSNSCRIVAIAYGPGWQFDESDQPFRILPAGVEEWSQTLVPMTALTDITPNPLNHQTRIRFQLHEPTRVQIRIRDVTGRTVATLADEALQSGYYHRDWEVAPTVSSGVFFLDITAGNFRATEKLIVTEGGR